MEQHGEGAAGVGSWQRTVKFIELSRVEGMRAYWKASTFAGANRVLCDWAQTAPSTGGYDKVHARIEWSNGRKYDYRLDLQHTSTGERPDVIRDVQHSIGFALGRVKHPGWTERQHEAVIARYQAMGVVAQMRDIEANCMIGDS